MKLFDTLDKKPKLYNIAVLSAAMLAAAVCLLHSNMENKTFGICLALDIYLALVILLLIRALIRQIRYNPYSYNTIYYNGFALFLLTVLITVIVLTVNSAKDPVNYGLQAVLSYLHSSSSNFMFFSLPFIIVFSAALCVSNISLIRHEGKRLVNLLGIILSVLMVGSALICIKIDFYVSGSEIEVMVHELIMNIFYSLYLYLECMLIGAIAADIIAAKHEPDPDKDFLIILGCGIQKDGKPTPLLRGRIDRALVFYRRQKEETGKELIFVPSGGQGPDEVISESASMKQYLLEQGIPGEQIIEEDQSADTFENMKYSKEKIWEIDPNAKVAFSTTNYHVFRGGLYARRVKMRAVGMGAKTKWYFWPNASVREFVGLLTEHRVKQAVVFISIIAVYTILTLLVYRWH